MNRKRIGLCFHTYRRVVFKEDFVVFGNGGDEDDRVHVLETVDPLLSFRPLAAHIEHSKKVMFRCTERDPSYLN